MSAFQADLSFFPLSHGTFHHFLIAIVRDVLHVIYCFLHVILHLIRCFFSAFSHLFWTFLGSISHLNTKMQTKSTDFLCFFNVFYTSIQQLLTFEQYSPIRYRTMLKLLLVNHFLFQLL